MINTGKEYAVANTPAMVYAVIAATLAYLGVWGWWLWLLLAVGTLANVYTEVPSRDD